VQIQSPRLQQTTDSDTFVTFVYNSNISIPRLRTEYGTYFIFETFLCDVARQKLLKSANDCFTIKITKLTYVILAYSHFFVVILLLHCIITL